MSSAAAREGSPRRGLGRHPGDLGHLVKLKSHVRIIVEQRAAAQDGDGQTFTNRLPCSLP
jgi:hypothetical protein